MQEVPPAAAGMSAERLEQAVAFARRAESPMDRDIGRALAGGHFSEPLPDGEIIGPTRPRGDPSGLILRGGRKVAAWGPTGAADMTFSVTKSYLALVAGIAVEDELFELDQTVSSTVPALFDTEQNVSITWRHLLQQTSEWQGTLWGKADRIDRNRSLDAAPGQPSLKGTHRDLAPPGTYWEYNDIRVNVLSLALLHAFRRPLPEVLKSRIMDPIGASDSWEWLGYDNAWLDLDGRKVQSVPGGGHWGGGLFISTEDHARIGQMMLQRGQFDDHQILPEAWIDACLTPCSLNPSYGLMWWLNTNRSLVPSAPETSFFAIGVGRNAIWVEPSLDLVAVVRWIDRDAFDGFVAHVLEAV